MIGYITYHKEMMLHLEAIRIPLGLLNDKIIDEIRERHPHIELTYSVHLLDNSHHGYIFIYINQDKNIYCRFDIQVPIPVVE